MRARIARGIHYVHAIYAHAFVDRADADFRDLRSRIPRSERSLTARRAVLPLSLSLSVRGGRIRALLIARPAFPRAARSRFDPDLSSAGETSVPGRLSNRIASTSEKRDGESGSSVITWRMQSGSARTIRRSRSKSENAGNSARLVATQCVMEWFVHEMDN